MDFSKGGAGGSGDEQDARNSRRRRKTCSRHTSYQIAKLEELFKDFPHPDEIQRRQLSMELGLEPRQIKFWFQNKRTQVKTKSERTDNTVLRAENEKMLSENFVIREALKSIICSSCGGPSLGEEERQFCMQNLKLENAKLKEEYDKLSKLLASYNGNPMFQPVLLPPTLQSSYDPSPGSLLNQAIEIPAVDQYIPSFDQYIPAPDQDIPAPDQCIPAPDQYFDLVLAISDDMLPNLTSITTDMDKARMMETATTAMEELVRLLRINEPFWFRSLDDGKFILQRESYEKIFPRGNRLKGSHVRVESSKDSRTVNMSGTQLVDMILDSDKWVDLFPTIVTKAQTIQVLESGLLGSRSGALQLMYEEMHILSPMVPSREFFFLRYCKQVEVGVWVIADVSFDFSKENASLSRTWRLPSGCMIHEMPNGSCKVTWVEHVEVDDKIQTHRLYRDLVCGNNAYGAERWVLTLERMCERFACASVENIPSRDAGGVINSPEGRRSVMKLSHRMVKSFCGTLDMSGKMNFPHLSRVSNSGVRVSVRKSTESGEPNGMIVIAATSFWLPHSPQNVFDFFTDDKRRFQWDALSYGNPLHEIAHISNGTHPGNCTSIIRPFIPNENNMLILQESCIDPLGSLVVYAPVDVTTMNVAMRGEDSSMLPILPSGFVISGDGRSNAVAGPSSGEHVGKSGGSLLTVAYQILACSPSAMRQLNMESVAAVNTLVSSTVEKIKVALNCTNLD